MEIIYEKDFEKDLLKIRNKKVLELIKNKIAEIKNSNSLSDVKNIKKLVGYKTFYRIRILEYRIGVEVIENKLIFACIFHRKDIYRYFPK